MWYNQQMIIKTHQVYAAHGGGFRREIGDAIEKMYIYNLAFLTD